MLKDSPKKASKKQRKSILELPQELHYLLFLSWPKQETPPSYFRDLEGEEEKEKKKNLILIFLVREIGAEEGMNISHIQKN